MANFPLGVSSVWQRLQWFWEVLLVPPEALDWDALRLGLEYDLLLLPEHMTDVPRGVETESLRQLFRHRLVRALQGALPTPALLRPYYQVVAPDRHGLYSAYQALQDTENMIRQLQTEMPVLQDPAVVQRLLEDEGVTTLSETAKSLMNPATDWECVVKGMVCLGAQLLDSQAAWLRLKSYLADLSSVEVATYVLAHSQEVTVLLVALRTLHTLPLACAAFEEAVLGPSQQLFSFAVRALQTSLPLGPEPQRQQLLWRFVLANLADEMVAQEVCYAAVRQAALQQLCLYPAESITTEHMSWLDQARERLDWTRESQLWALQALTTWHVYVGYETAAEALRWAVHRDYQELAEIALDVLGRLQDPRAIALLRNLRRHLARNISPLERLGGVFSGVKNPLDEALVNALQTLGVTGLIHPVTGRWEEDK